MNDRRNILLDNINLSLDEFFYNMKQIFQYIHAHGVLPEAPLFLMYILWFNGPRKISDIAQRLGITSGAITQMSDKLIEMGLISRERSEEDRRVVWLSLTEKGDQTVREIQNQRFQLVRDRLCDLDEEALEQITNAFNQLNLHLNPEKKNK